MPGTSVRSLSSEGLLGQAAPGPRGEEPGGLQTMGAESGMTSTHTALRQEDDYKSRDVCIFL